MVIRQPADFYDADGVLIEIGQQVSVITWDMYGMETRIYGEVCRTDEDSALPIGIVYDASNYSEDDVMWVAPEDITQA